MSKSVKCRVLTRFARACSVVLVLALGAGTASAQLSSYATSASDVVGSTGVAAVGLGVPDYMFVNDSGLGFGGTSTDVFDVGESVLLTFPTPLRIMSLSMISSSPRLSGAWAPRTMPKCRLRLVPME